MGNYKALGENVEGKPAMLYIRATEKHAEQAIALVQETIKTVYPKYYPKEVVDFFCAHHSGEKIKADIMHGNVWVLFCDDQLVGTGCRADNHLTRVYVLPAFQGKGYGSYIMGQLEDEIGKKYNEVVLDASLPAVCLYEKRSYKTVKHEKLIVENDVALVYEVMKKKLCSSTTSICYDGRFFVPKVNTENGEVDKRTVFAYRQTGDMVSAEYSGGDIIKGCLLGTVTENGELDFHYQHINADKQVRIGKCHSVPHILDNGKLELHEEWQWLNGDTSRGSSVVVEQ
jgi:GNAT superfamily N-acetyltransferase